MKHIKKLNEIINFDDFTVKSVKSEIDFTDIEDYFQELKDKEYGVQISIKEGNTPTTLELEDIPDDQPFPRCLIHVLSIKSKFIFTSDDYLDFNYWEIVTKNNLIILNSLKEISSQKGLEISSIGRDGSKLIATLLEKI